MKPQFDNKVMSSFFLWFDNKLLDKGEAFENVTENFMMHQKSMEVIKLTLALIHSLWPTHL